MSAAATRTDVDIQVASKAADLPDETWIADWVRAAIDGADPRQAESLEVAVRIVDESEMQLLNHEYRGKDRPTNVLSFPAGDDGFAPPDIPVALGDIVICAPVVQSEAAEQGKAPEAHWAHMIVHGALHLLGYDHEEPPEAEAMESLEVRILSQRGIGDPYNLS